MAKSTVGDLTHEIGLKTVKFISSTRPLQFRKLTIEELDSIYGTTRRIQSTC